MDEIQTPQPARKFSRVSSNGARIDSSANSNLAAVEPENKLQPSSSAAATAPASGELVALSSNRLRQWPHSSRIIRVSRASGGKDRHSKVWTARGPRDRRVRLSVNTAIQFYDLQDRLGYEQPSKAVEWLIKAAADAINELPSLDSCATFPPETPRQLSDERRAESPDPDPGGGSHTGLGQTHPHNQQQLSRSGCSSNNSENSKGSGGLSLSRSEIRVKARERARERTAKENKERENEPTTRVQGSAAHHNHPQQQQNVSSNMAPQTSSFTQLLTAGITNLNESNRAASSSSPMASSLSPDVGLFHKQARGSATNQWLTSPSTTAMDYFGNTLHSHSHPQVMAISDNHHQLSHHHNHQNFAFLSDHQHQQNLIQVPNSTTTTSGNIYNFNFTISSSSATSSTGLGPAGFNSRGTLQSNSPSSLLPYLQRFNSTTTNNTTTDHGNSPNVSVPFFLGGAAVSSAGPTEETHHHQFHPPGLQLCYGDGARQSDHQKGKSKNNN